MATTSTSVAPKRARTAFTNDDIDFLKETIVDLRETIKESNKSISYFRNALASSQKEIERLKRQVLPQSHHHATINVPKEDLTIIVTNIDEEENGQPINETALIANLTKKINPNIMPKAVKRIGLKVQGKTRKIAVELNSKSERDEIIKNAPEIIKADPKLRANKVFFNRSLPLPEQEIQYQLRKLKKDAQLLPQYKDKRLVISKNQVIDYETKLPIDGIANNNAKSFYNSKHPFRPSLFSTASSTFEPMQH